MRLSGICAMRSFSGAVLLITHSPCSFLSCFSYNSVFSTGTQLIEGIYILKRPLLGWLTGCGLGGLIVTVSSCEGGYLSCLDLVLKAWRIPGELLILSLQWNSKEVSSVIGEGML